MRIVFAWRAARGPGAILLACLALVLAVPAHAEQRIALVIANSAYTAPSLGRLPGTHDDAVRMAAALQADGFRVRSVADLDKQALRRAIADFVGDLNRAGKEGVGFLYYSGHGIADAPRGQNYLIPVDADIRSEAELPLYAEAMDDVLDAVEAAGAKAAFVVFDACRSTSTSLSRGSKGLQPARARTDTLIAFATAPGQTASDDGLYARVLAEELQSQGADSETLFQRVQRKVAESTGRRQVPQFISSLVDKVQFTPGNKLVIPSIVPPTVSRTETGDPYVRWGLTKQEFQFEHDDEIKFRVGARLSRQLTELTSAAQSGDAAAQNLVGFCYENGIGVNLDYAKAMQWYRMAANVGNSTAMNRIALLYQGARGVPMNYSEASDWYLKSIKIGDTRAITAIGNIFFLGKTYDEALRFYREAAERKDPDGMNNLGNLYLSGNGVNKDYAEALRWYRKAAEMGNPSSMKDIGRMYNFGVGVVEDDAEAMRWYHKAADLGQSDAMILIGDLWQYGQGVKQDDAEARRWYERAAGLGNGEATKKLSQLTVVGH